MVRERLLEWLGPLGESVVRRSAEPTEDIVSSELRGVGESLTVVPDLAYVVMMISSGLNLTSFQIDDSM